MICVLKCVLCSAQCVGCTTLKDNGRPVQLTMHRKNQMSVICTVEHDVGVHDSYTLWFVTTWNCKKKNNTANHQGEAGKSAATSTKTVDCKHFSALNSPTKKVLSTARIMSLSQSQAFQFTQGLLASSAPASISSFSKLNMAGFPKRNRKQGKSYWVGKSYPAGFLPERSPHSALQQTILSMWCTAEVHQQLQNKKHQRTNNIT